MHNNVYTVAQVNKSQSKKLIRGVVQDESRRFTLTDIWRHRRRLHYILLPTSSDSYRFLSARNRPSSGDTDMTLLISIVILFILPVLLPVPRPTPITIRNPIT